MIAAWMLYSLVTGALIAGGALGVERAFRIMGWPIRGVWAGAMVLTVTVAVLAPTRVADSRQHDAPAFVIYPSPPPPEFIESGAAASVASPDLVALAFSGAREALASAAAGAPRFLERYLSLLWGGSAAGMLAIIFFTHHRLRRRRRSWPRSEVHGTRVRLTPTLGPAVVGVARPEIVVPRWFLQLPDAESRLVLRHEAEHLRARDPLLLTFSWCLAALLAWNPALWWMLGRLRLAIEVDCDARVLRGGANRRSYGAVLIELAGRSSQLRPGMLALADPPSQLERRLLAMTTHRSRFALLRASALAAVAGTAILAACVAELPTSAQIQALNVERAEEAARTLGVATDAGTVYVLDGVVVTRDAVLALPAERIASIAVERTRVPEGTPRAEASTARIAVVTRDAFARGDAPAVLLRDSANAVGYSIRVRGDSAARTVAPGEVVAIGSGSVRIRDQNPGAPNTVATTTTVWSQGQTPPLYVVDGVIVTPQPGSNPLATMNPANLQSITVLKDGSATAQFGPEGANGVVVVTTRAAARAASSPLQNRSVFWSSISSEQSGLRPEQVSSAFERIPPETAVWALDGVRTSRAALQAQPASQIAGIGFTYAPVPERLITQYGPDAAQGVAEFRSVRPAR